MTYLVEVHLALSACFQRKCYCHVSRSQWPPSIEFRHFIHRMASGYTIFALVCICLLSSVDGHEMSKWILYFNVKRRWFLSKTKSTIFEGKCSKYECHQCQYFFNLVPKYFINIANQHFHWYDLLETRVYVFEFIISKWKTRFWSNKHKYIYQYNEHYSKLNNKNIFCPV